MEKEEEKKSSSNTSNLTKLNDLPALNKRSQSAKPPKDDFDFDFEDIEKKEQD